ncbi:MAG: Holliday junction branch migration protein RuvA [Clostridiales bacterium]|nr:Holliday junction branch migration protein RuvA [Clostridiales bacterium]
MYAFIEGEVCEKLNGSLVLLASGVGWQLNCSNNTLQAAPPLGEKMRCWTYLSVREDAMELFGFATREEKEMFLQLTSVSGIGPKTALGVLGAMPLRELNLAILLGDVNALSRAPGIGKKTAQRIALELKDKISQSDVSVAVPSQGTSAAAPDLSPDAVTEAIEAMIALGYSSTEARNAISQVRDQTDKPEELIRLALRSMAGF